MSNRKKRAKRSRTAIISATVLTLSLLAATEIEAELIELNEAPLPNEEQEVEEFQSQDAELTTEELPIKSSGRDKTYMSVWAITDTSSKQYEFIHRSGNVHIDGNGYLYCFGDYIGVALGSKYGPVGTKYVVTLSSGQALKLCKVEEKADKDTRNKEGWVGINGDIIEFVIDHNAQDMRDNIWSNGLIFQGNFNNNPDFEGEIVKFERVIEE